MTTRTAVQDPVGAIALLDEPRRRQLYEFVLGSREPVGRDESAAASGMSRELVAFHLDRLVAGGLLETEYRRLGGRRGPGAGRPAKLYRRTDHDVAVTFPTRDYERAADLLAGALEGLDRDTSRLGSTAVGDVAHARGEAAGVEVHRNAGRSPSRRRLRAALLDLLWRAGYEPEVAPDTGGICLRNCPYHALVVNHRDLACGMNVAWAKGLLEGLGGAHLEAQLAPPDGHCCVVFSDMAPDSVITKRSQDAPARLKDKTG